MKDIFASYGNSEKIRAPDGIWTHDPPRSSTDALTTELLETLVASKGEMWV